MIFSPPPPTQRSPPPNTRQHLHPHLMRPCHILHPVIVTRPFTCNSSPNPPWPDFLLGIRTVPTISEDRPSRPCRRGCPEGRIEKSVVYAVVFGKVNVGGVYHCVAVVPLPCSLRSSNFWNVVQKVWVLAHVQAMGLRILNLKSEVKKSWWLLRYAGDM